MSPTIYKPALSHQIQYIFYRITILVQMSYIQRNKIKLYKVKCVCYTKQIPNLKSIFQL